MKNATIEDCLKLIPNKFELILETSYRAKTLINGFSPLYETDKLSNVVISLNEIGNNLLDVVELKKITENDIKNKEKFFDNEKNTEEVEIVNVKKIENVDGEELSVDGQADEIDIEIDEEEEDDEINLGLDNVEDEIDDDEEK
ncbi:MAG: DNA-directed RNA polymerase subunit omega [Rickettsiales bacterium]|jgi:DNA-directed RNA polymerase subunit omega|nr:DNA-directed RNA polymerase subunit omega [Rickettsiales bacterium]